MKNFQNKNQRRVALLHDYLNQYGGGERVLEVLMEMFPDAPVYTLFYDRNQTLNRFSHKVKKTSFLNLPFVKKHHRLFVPLMPIAAQLLKIPNEYKVVISATAGFAKGIRTYKNPKRGNGKVLHISYIHTPLRYAWEPDYINSKFKNPKSTWRNLFLNPVLSYLQKWDYNAAQKPDVLIANSKFIADKVWRYYGRKAHVVYPPVDTKKFYFEKKINHDHPLNSHHRGPLLNCRACNSGQYYLAVGRLLHYKRFDLIIDVFANLGLPLKIVGTGPESKKLKAQCSQLNAQNIEFTDFVQDDNELRKLYNNAKALLFPQVEDFGLVAAEAQACGCPVIAYNAGGAKEIIKHNQTGILFTQQTPESLINAIRDADNVKWDRKKIAESAKRFSKENFKKEILKLLNHYSSNQ